MRTSCAAGTLTHCACAASAGDAASCGACACGAAHMAAAAAQEERRRAGVSVAAPAHRRASSSQPNAPPLVCSAAAAMPPRRSARVAAAVELRCTALWPLPHAVVLHIFGLLPLDSRLRAAGVCRGWRAAILEPQLWASLDMTAAAGVPRAFANNTLLYTAARRSRGSLTSIDVSGCTRVSHGALRTVAAAHALTLRELRAHEWLNVSPDDEELGHCEARQKRGFALSRCLPLCSRRAGPACLPRLPRSKLRRCCTRRRG
jgi:hypothetical protein